MMEGVKSGEVPKLPRNWPITQTDMTRWWKDFSAKKWVSYNATNEPIVCGHWLMVGGSIGPCVQSTLPNHVPIIIAAEALAPARHAAERQNGDMVKETRKKLEKLAGDRLVLAEMIKDCVEPILSIRMRTPEGPALFEDPTQPLDPTGVGSHWIRHSHYQNIQSS